VHQSAAVGDEEELAAEVAWRTMRSPSPTWRSSQCSTKVAAIKLSPGSLLANKTLRMVSAEANAQRGTKVTMARVASSRRLSRAPRQHNIAWVSRPCCAKVSAAMR
jgi:hypothetical protein